MGLLDDEAFDRDPLEGGVVDLDAEPRTRRDRDPQSTGSSGRGTISYCARSISAGYQVEQVIALRHGLLAQAGERLQPGCEPDLASQVWGTHRRRWSAASPPTKITSPMPPAVTGSGWMMSTPPATSSASASPRVSLSSPPAIGISRSWASSGYPTYPSNGGSGSSNQANPSSWRQRPIARAVVGELPLPSATNVSASWGAPAEFLGCLALLTLLEHTEPELHRGEAAPGERLGLADPGVGGRVADVGAVARGDGLDPIPPRAAVQRRDRHAEATPDQVIERNRDAGDRETVREGLAQPVGDPVALERVGADQPWREGGEGGHRPRNGTASP